MKEEGGGRDLLVDGALSRPLGGKPDPVEVVVDAGLAAPDVEADPIVDFGLCAVRAVDAVDAVETGFRTEEVDEDGLLIVPPVPVLDAIVVEVPFADEFVLEAVLVVAVAGAGVGTFDEVVDLAGGAVGRVPEETFRTVAIAFAVADLGPVEDGIRLVDVEELGPF